MKHLKFILSLILISGFLFSCKDKGKKTKIDIQKNVESTEKPTKKTATDSIQEALVFNWVKPTSSKNRELRTNENNQERHTLDVTNTNNNFSVSSDKIKMYIPVTNASMKIKAATNVSSNDFNAIVVHLDGNSGKPTLGSSVSRMIEVEFPLKKIFPKTDKLKTDKLIIVKILHDDYPVTVNQMTLCLKRCIKNETRTYDNFNLDCECDEEFPKIVDEQPKEVDGSILKGGN